MACIEVFPFIIGGKAHRVTVFPVNDYLKKNGSATVPDNKAIREKMKLPETKDMKNVVIVKIVNREPVFQCICIQESFGHQVAHFGILSDIANDPNIQLGYFYFGDHMLVEYFSKDSGPVQAVYSLTNCDVISKGFNCDVVVHTAGVNETRHFDMTKDLDVGNLLRFIKDSEFIGDHTKE